MVTSPPLNWLCHRLARSSLLPVRARQERGAGKWNVWESRHLLGGPGPGSGSWSQKGFVPLPSYPDSAPLHLGLVLFLFFFLRFYLFIHEGHTQRGRDTGRGRCRVPVRSLMRDMIPGDHDLKEGRCSTAEPPMCPPTPPPMLSQQEKRAAQQRATLTPGVQ